MKNQVMITNRAIECIQVYPDTGAKRAGMNLPAGREVRNFVTFAGRVDFEYKSGDAWYPARYVSPFAHLLMWITASARTVRA